FAAPTPRPPIPQEPRAPRPQARHSELHHHINPARITASESNEELLMTYAKPGADGSIVSYANRYDNFIGGDWTAPVEGKYFDNPSPVDGETFCEVARSTAPDVELALDAAHAAAD